MASLPERDLDNEATGAAGLPGTLAHSRRGLLRAAVGTASAWLAGCDKRMPNGSLHAQEKAATSVTQTVVDTEALVASFLERQPLPGRYRSQQKYLFQGVPKRELPSRLPDGKPMLWDNFGPTHRYVDVHTGWAWSRPGGDWIDALGRRHGPTPWFSVQVGDAHGAESVAHYFADVNRLVKLSQTQHRWLALLLIAPSAARTIAGTGASAHPAPAIDVVYADGERARLRCRIVAALDARSSLPITAAPQVNLPACLEFEPPARSVASATLSFTVTAHWSGANPVIEGFLLDPPVNSDSRSDGLSAQAGPLDDGLDALPEVIGTHRYLDGYRLADFVHMNQASLGSEHQFDPAIYGTGSQDIKKWPHAGLGKWINANTTWELVTSGYKPEGFKPLAPGLGALRLHMPATSQVHDGAVVGFEGTTAANAMIFLPEPLFGRLDRIFVRFYLRLGLPGQTQARQRYQVRHAPGDSDWTALAGKFGIAPDHSTSQGGVSGSSGGGAGWQMRLSWYECDAGMGGPDERGLAPGFHLYDFQTNNPPGHRYGTDQPSQFERWGQRGGLGGMLYAGHWYCIETELKLNTVSSSAPGFHADGELRAWIDGRLTFARTGLVMRSLPLANRPAKPSRIRPCRELGVRGLWLNWFHGGKTVNTVDRTMFYTGLAWAKRYIGPMKL